MLLPDYFAALDKHKAEVRKLTKARYDNKLSSKDFSKKFNQLITELEVFRYKISSGGYVLDFSDFAVKEKMDFKVLSLDEWLKKEKS